MYRDPLNSRLILAMPIQFFFASGACSLCPHILLHEVGADFEPVQVINNGVQVDFSIKPKMRVLVIVIHDQIITELPAVATIIANLAPERHLRYKTPIETARVYEWIKYLSGTLHTGRSGHLSTGSLDCRNDEDSLQAVKAKACENIRECLGYIEGRLDGVHAVGVSRP